MATRVETATYENPIWSGTVHYIRFDNGISAEIHLPKGCGKRIDAYDVAEDIKNCMK